MRASSQRRDDAALRSRAPTTDLNKRVDVFIEDGAQRRRFGKRGTNASGTGQLRSDVAIALQPALAMVLDALDVKALS